MRPCLAVLSVIACLSVLAQPQPLAPAPVMPTSFALGGPSIAAAGGRFLSSWTVNTTTGNRVDGMAIDENGKPVSIVERRLIVPAATSKILPSGTEFLLSYEDTRSYRRFMRMSKEGASLGDEGFPILTNAPAVFASEDGKRILVLRFGAPFFEAELLDERGAVVKSGITLGRAETGLAILPAGDGFLLLTALKNTLTVRVMHSDGRIDDPLQIASSPDITVWIGSYSYTRSAAAATGSRLVLFWNVRKIPGPVTIAGAVIENGAVVKSLSIPAEDFTIGKLLWTGRQYVLFGSRGAFGSEQICAMRFDSNADPVDAQPVVLTDSQSRHAFTDAAWNGSTFCVVGKTSSDVVEINVGPSMANPWTTVLSFLAARQNGPVIASGPDNSLAVWHESSAIGESIRAAIVRNGRAMEPYTLATGRYLPDAAVAYGNGVYLIAWETIKEVVGVRITSSGLLLDPTPFPIVEKSGSVSYGLKPAIAWNGSAFLVAWTDDGIRGALVTTAGTVGMDRQLIASAEQPALAWNGERFLLAGTVKIFLPINETESTISALTLAADGTPAATKLTRLMYAQRPSVATSGHEFFLTATADAGQILGMWLDNGGTRLRPPFRIADLFTGFIQDYWPATSMSWNGKAYLVAANTRRDGTWSLQVNAFQPLQVTASSSRTLATRPDWGRITSTAIGLEGERAWVLFDDVSDDEAPGGSSRVMIIPVDEVPALRHRAASR